MKNLRVACLIGLACVPLLAQEKPGEPKVVKLASPLPVSTQGKAAEAIDIAIEAVHSGAGGEKCDVRGCASPMHWLAEVRLGTGAQATSKTFAVGATLDLQQHLEWAASPKARTKHADRVNVSDAKLSIRVPAETPWPIVCMLLDVATRAGIHDVGFAVVPAEDAQELRLATPLPEGVRLGAKDPKATQPELRIALLTDRATGACVRMVDRTRIADGAAGDAELRAKLTDAAAKQKATAILDAATGVEWRAVVSVIDACRAANVDVQFSTSCLPM